MKPSGYVSIAALMLVAGCVKNPVNTGYITEFEDFSTIQAGQTTQEEVLSQFGSPSITSDYGDPTWYYVGTRSKRIAFLDPEVDKHSAYSITFNEDGTVKEVSQATENDRRNIAISDDKTYTEGNEVTIVEQLVGNLGKFNPAGATGR